MAHSTNARSILPSNACGYPALARIRNGLSQQFYCTEREQPRTVAERRAFHVGYSFGFPFRCCVSRGRSGRARKGQCAWYARIDTGGVGKQRSWGAARQHRIGVRQRARPYGSLSDGCSRHASGGHDSCRGIVH